MFKIIVAGALVLMGPGVCFSQNQYQYYPSQKLNCVVGNPELRTYADQMTKSHFGQDDSFLKAYWRHRFLSLLPSYIHKTQFVERISKDKIMCSIRNIPYVLGNRILCEGSTQKGASFTNETPCVTNLMVDYIYWGVNEALNCFSNYMDDYVQTIIFRKIHLESSFGFFFQYSGGTGMMQLVSAGKNEMYKDGEGGHQFLVDHVRAHPRQCQNFKELLDRTQTTKDLFSCRFISIGDGIGRNLLGGIGLYIYYRSGPKNKFSAENILSYWGYKKTNSYMYKKARAYIASGMYNKGVGAVYDEIHHLIPKNGLVKLSEKKKYQRIMKLIYHSSFAGYIHGIENNSSRIFDQSGQCNIHAPTSGVIAYQHSEPPLSLFPLTLDGHEMPERYLHWKR